MVNCWFYCCYFLKNCKKLYVILYFLYEHSRDFTLRQDRFHFKLQIFHLPPQWLCNRIPEQNARKQSDVHLSCCNTHSTPFADFTSNSVLGTEFAFCFLSPCRFQHPHHRHFHRFSLYCKLVLSLHFRGHRSHLHDSIADYFSLDIPSINVNLDSLLDEFRVAPCRSFFAAVSSPEGESVSEEEGQSTTIWPLSPPSSMPDSPRTHPLLLRPNWNPTLDKPSVTDTTWETHDKTPTTQQVPLKKSNRMDFVQIATGGTWSFVFWFLFLAERFCLFNFVVVLVSFDWDVFISALSELQLKYNAHRERSADFKGTSYTLSCWRLWTETHPHGMRVGRLRFPYRVHAMLFIDDLVAYSMFKSNFAMLWSSFFLSQSL